MDKQQVDIIGADPLESLFDSILLLIESRPELGFEEYLLARQTRALHCAADGFFVAVGVCRVDESVSALEGAECGRLRLIGSHKKCSDALHGHFHTVVKLCIFHGHFLLK